jgi:hypothetical protein
VLDLTKTVMMWNGRAYALTRFAKHSWMPSPSSSARKWAHPETPENARKLSVEWRIGSEVSDGLRGFRAYTP